MWFLYRSSCNLLFDFLHLAAPRQRIELTFDEPYYIEPSFECRFDHLEVRDGPFGFSPLINRYCGLKSPALIRSTGRFMWIKFTSDEELEGKGFQAKYSFIPGKDALNSDPVMSVRGCRCQRSRAACHQACSCRQSDIAIVTASVLLILQHPGLKPLRKIA